MKKNITLSCFFAIQLFLPLLLQAQTSLLESRYWYFGTRAGIRFRAHPDSLNYPPVAVGDAANDLQALEGSAAISNPKGGLLFYVGTRGGNADYATAWNKNHQRMVNGDSLIGGSSSTQNALIVRQPGNSNNYIIFQVAQLENYSATGTAPRDVGMYYSVVDTTLDNGNGAVIRGRKNILIIDSVSEKVSAVLHRNGRDIWIVGHRYNSSDFFAVLVSDTGVSSSPVISRLGIRYGTGPDGVANYQFNRGALKLSPNGNRVASCVSALYPNQSFYAQVGEFNNLTGQISNVFHIPVQDGPGVYGPYGVEFSPDNSKLYIGDRSNDKIYQFDLCAGEDSTSIINSKYTITPGTNWEPGILQLGLDGRIYVSRVTGALGGSLGCITNPNEAGAACQFNGSYVQLTANARCDRGLTNVNQSIFNDLAGTIEYARLCERETVSFHGQAQCQGIIASYRWDFGDTASGALNYDTLQDPQHYYARPGRYLVRLVINAGNFVDSTEELITITPLARGSVIHDSLACHQSYTYTFDQDSVNHPGVKVTNYRWHITGYLDTTLEGPGRRSIELTWDSNHVAQFALYLETTTTLGETCISDSIPFRVIVNQRKGATPTIPDDTLCLDPEIPFVITSPDEPRSQYQWVYSPGSDPARIEGQGEKILSVYPTTPGPKSVRTAFFLDRPNMICYTESAQLRFFAAAAPADSITIWGDSSICSTPLSVFESYGRNGTSTVHWNFAKLASSGAGVFQSDTVGDSVRVRFDNLSIGRNQYYLQAQEVSKDGCRGPVSRKEIWNACIEFPTIVTANNDGQNDVFKIGNGESFPDSEIKIFNRWGKQVYSGKAGDTPDMRDLSPGTYFYRLRVFWEGQNKEQTGWFEVLR